MVSERLNHPAARLALHYIYDPLCGWCYAVAPLILEARRRLAVIAHGGGMMVGARRQAVTPQLRNFVRPHDQHIALLSGQPFGAAYIDGLLRDSTAVFDSAPPTAAVLAAEQVGACGLDLLAALQRAHYVEGRRIAELPVLVEIASAIGLAAEPFEQALRAQLDSGLDAHFEQTRLLMQRHGVQGFPSLLLAGPHGIQRLEWRSFLARPADFGQWLDECQAQVVGRDSADPPACGLDACTTVPQR